MSAALDPLPVEIGADGITAGEARNRLAAVLGGAPFDAAWRARIESVELRVPMEQGPGDDALFEAYRRLLRLWNVAEPPPIASHRRFVGPLLVMLKRLTRRLLAFEIDPFFARQASFNRAVLDLVRVLLAEIGRLRRKVSELERERR